MDVVFASTETTVIIDGREYMKGDIFPVLENEGYYFYSKDPLKRMTWWIRFNHAINSETGQPFANIGAFTTWVNENVYPAGEAPGAATVKTVNGESPDANGNVALTAEDVGAPTATTAQFNAKLTATTAQFNGKLTATTAAFNAKLTASQAAAQADSTAADVPTLVIDFNALLAKLRTAGIIAP